MCNSKPVYFDADIDTHFTKIELESKCTNIGAFRTKTTIYDRTCCHNSWRPNVKWITEKSSIKDIWQGPKGDYFYHYLRKFLLPWRIFINVQFGRNFFFSYLLNHTLEFVQIKNTYKIYPPLFMQNIYKSTVTLILKWECKVCWCPSSFVVFWWQIGIINTVHERNNLLKTLFLTFLRSSHHVITVTA